MVGKYFDELEVGDQFTSPRRTVTEADVVIFTSLTGLLNPLFTDEEFAREKGLGGRVAPGPLTISYAIGLTDELVFGTVAAVLEIAAELDKTPAQVSLAWVLSHPEITVADVGCDTIDQLDENLGALETELSQDQLDRLNGM